MAYNELSPGAGSLVRKSKRSQQTRDDEDKPPLGIMGSAAFDLGLQGPARKQQGAAVTLNLQQNTAPQHPSSYYSQPTNMSQEAFEDPNRQAIGDFGLSAGQRGIAWSRYTGKYGVYPTVPRWS